MNDDLSFQQEVNERLAQAGPELSYCKADEKQFYLEQYQYIEQYIYHHHLKNAAVALPIVCSLHDGVYRGYLHLADGTERPAPFVSHCLSVCRMLIDYSIPLTHHEEDIMLASALCHNLLTKSRKDSSLLVSRALALLDPDVADIVSRFVWESTDRRKDENLYLSRIRENKLATLIRLADWSDVVSTMPDLSIWQVHEYAHESRMLYFPLCVYAMEQYPECSLALSILHEKILTLVEAGEMLVNRYAKREEELMSDILSLREQNARYRQLIRSRQAGCEQE